MLRFYIDDSGRSEEPVFVFAGYVARVQNWSAFSDAWHKVLDKPKARKLRYLHTKDAYRLEGEFKGWSEADRDTRLLEFVSTIKKYCRYGVKAMVSHEDFARIYAGTPGKKLPAYMLAWILIRMVSILRDSPTREKAEFIFDCNMADRRSLTKEYKRMCQMVPELADSITKEPSFQSDEECLPLQAADLLAWHVRRESHERSLGHKLELPVWKALQEIEIVDASLNEKDLLEIRNEVIRRVTPRLKARQHEARALRVS